MRSAFTLFGALFCSFLLSACGGGGSALSDPGNGQTPPSGSNTISLTISNSDINADTPATLTATVQNSLTGAVSGELVTFTLNDSSLGTFVPAIGTALTNANGVATVTLATSNVPGAGTVAASIASGASATVGFTMAGDGGASGGSAQITLKLTDTNGTVINSITSTTPGVLTATVKGISKQVIVTFDSTIGDLPVKTAITDANGVASVSVYAGSTPGAGTATASIATGESADQVFVVGASNIMMGSGTPFVSGKASVSTLTLSAGGTATISVMLQDADGNPFTEPVDVSFASKCSKSATPQAVLSSPVTAVNGLASSTYLAKGCVGDDNITVSADVGGKSLSATGVINVLAADAGSIVFIDATPENIGIKGTGSDESSTLRFKVLDTNGNPVANKSVTFSLNTAVGGLTINPPSAMTNSDGIAQTVVNSGTVATSVRVTAAIADTDPVISSQSSVLVISTGVPDQDSFSLSAEELNTEGWDIDGTQVPVTARLADAFNNPVPDGTAVYFTTEGGAITPSCVTSNGACTVTWTSQNVRPEGQTLIDSFGDMYRNPRAELSASGGNYYGQKFGGRATITATAIGEESFPDLNGNGRFDASEVTAFLGNDVGGHPYDLDEAFGDYNEDGVFNPEQTGGQAGGELEELIDFNKNGTFDSKDGKYNGVLCSIPAHNGCANGIDQPKSIDVRANLVLVMSGSNAYATVANDIRIVDRDGDNLGGNIDINGKSTAIVQFTIADLHNQQMPAGTVVTFTTSAGSVASSANYTWPSSNHNGGRQFSVTLKGADQPDSGAFIVTVETPGGLTTEVVNIPVNIY
ncbi:Ig-like domain-containing protein [Shewanella dokdonensis]|uniref:Ig-like domain-containing protein n=1 Tax=Shewanella dokdonensis TaxID=712036 RepID=UPI002010841B|nr:Ig-like domain-containing protein [Shewanella dokdonensis]MCL1075165.1 Ig-like domain-containing protein [Shewanella dokdonensis]